MVVAVIFKLPAGLARIPDRETEAMLLSGQEFAASAITVVPSQSFAVSVVLPPAPASIVTCPLANQVPELPCDTKGPSKGLVVDKETSPVVGAVRAVKTEELVDVEEDVLVD